MCGIAGLIVPTGQTPDEAILDRLAEALAHRGPDGRGRYLRGNVGLIQNRLSIIDLQGGRQPILDADGRAIVANGEIYNYRELRDQLDGISFTTASDSEPPLHLYARDGENFADQLRGMYALAIHDPLRDVVVLARDPFGVKPLYLAQGSWGIAFASEAQALIKAGLVTARVTPQARAELLQLQFTCGEETIFAGVSRVPAGATLVIEAGRIRLARLRPALPRGGSRGGGADSLLDQLDRVLTDSVDLHQRADVPYGMFLSGGIDSSVLLALMARLNPRPVLAYTAGFPGSAAHDERAHARALARQVGAEHIEVEFTEADFWRLLPQVAAAMDDPAADYACLPTFKLAVRAGQDVKIILSGEGGDELFGGYGRYRKVMRPWPLCKRMRRKGIFDKLDVLQPMPGWRDRYAQSEAACCAVPGRTRLQAAQAMDCTDWLANDLLIKADRCLMANAIEGRVPFLDPVVADFAFSLADRWKVRHGQGKHLLRLWLDKAMPAARPFDAKRGFTVPVGPWMAARPAIGALVAAQAGIAEIAVPGRVEKLFADAGDKTAFARWSLLFYALWHQTHILGVAAHGDAFETLSAR
ncbi:asparagine synthase (glutamine-hydrolyzing) [Magnetospirillum sulfuroxidans]|uniref:asparagine synthase (glutamine-hydrolyzing) n=1 Tax=Magnetospirillum sulfuroxidans TaxID=611300 RepID=A0ABS5IDL1_9PROT|nr:asparagine synthase (glutamine-hydrolyzing) [Magnetospirillum sulfuroxidans]MBR9972267.1 asparagine synthase (glutamine-hydrolyzing) [Magnetospirillum sulfuroxidans]